MSGQNDRLSLIFRRNAKWDLDDGWKLATRIDLPITFANAVTDANPNGNYEAGLGRALVSAYLADEIDDRWAYAFGSRIRAPASGSAFGSGNWEIAPIVAARYMLPEITDGSYFVPQLRYAQSFAQSFSSRSTSNLQFAPQLKVALPDKWFVIAWPSTDIRWNFGPKASGQTGRLFFPLDLAIGHNLTQARTVSLEVSAPVIRDYPVYRIKIEARLSAQF
ncbi:MAG TPA: transporter [Rhizomicrobium sp.]|nr:transporter [Rhizomicrobium sp.]